MEENLVQINGGITIDTDVSIRNIMYVKKFILEILVHVYVKRENIFQFL